MIEKKTRGRPKKTTQIEMGYNIPPVAHNYMNAMGDVTERIEIVIADFQKQLDKFYYSAVIQGVILATLVFYTISVALS